WDTAKLGMPWPHNRAPIPPILSTNFSPDGTTILIASADGIIRLWDMHTEEFRGSVGHARISVRSATFSPDGGTILTASVDHAAYLWDAQDGRQLHRLDGHTQAVNSARFSPDGST